MPLLWCCKEGHLWQASFGNVKSGTLYPFYYKYKYEQLCWEIVTKYLGPPSENRKPDFLKIPEGLYITQNIVLQLKCKKSNIKGV